MLDKSFTVIDIRADKLEGLGRVILILSTTNFTAKLTVLMDIMLMTERHLAAADQLRRLAGWNQTPEDWSALLSLEPDGCFVAMDEGDVIGTVTTTTYGRELAWIGMMLVHPEHRRRGIGTHLMQTALDYLTRSRGIDCIRLDATPVGRPVYDKLGFVAEWTFTRHQAPSIIGRPSQGTRELAKADWSAIERFDSTVFGVSRTRVLQTVAQASRSALVWPARGPVLGYGMLRSGSQSDYLGPLVCVTPAALPPLVSALLRKVNGRSAFWDIADENTPVVQLAKEFGFKPVRPLTRMRLGSDSVRTNLAAQLAMADPSIG
jgi:GNAT superfamily N-acetyltransferase